MNKEIKEPAGRASRKSVTQQQIAAATNLSLATVSAVLSGKASLRRIAQETVEQVWTVSNQLGYQLPVRTAKTQSLNIGIILRHGVRYALSNPFYGEIFEGIEEILAEENCHPLFANPFEVEAESAGVPGIVAQGKVAGVILLGQVEGAYIKRLCDFGIKLVAVNFEAGRMMPSIVIDGIKENILAMEYLADQGHTQIAYMSSGVGTQYSKFLEQGYRQGLAAGYKPLVLRSVTGGNMEDGIQTVNQYLKTLSPGPLPFTCLLAENDTLASGAMLALQSAGFNVPQDVSVMGGQDLYLPYPLPAKLTTTSIDKRYMGRTAVRLILDSLKSDQNLPVQVTVQASLCVRESVRKLSGGMV